MVRQIVLVQSEAASFPLFACTVLQRLRFGHSNEKIALQEQKSVPLCKKLNSFFPEMDTTEMEMDTQ